MRARHGQWVSAQHTKRGFISVYRSENANHVRLRPGHLVIFEQRAYRVLEINEKPEDLWPAEYEQAWARRIAERDAYEARRLAGDPQITGGVWGELKRSEWIDRPIVVVVQDEEDRKAKPLHLEAPASLLWDVLPEHYSVCRLCGELPPCRHEETERIVSEEVAVSERLMAILPGSCHACREPITRRQKSFTFPGPNLIRPDLGDDSARFHTRSGCYNAMFHYDERWAKATGRRRFFWCPGNQVEHYDGTVECSEPECPGNVQHQAWQKHARFRDMRDVAWSGCWCIAGVGQTTIEDVA